jgi:NADH-quinone oxidoreductase subunit L
MDLPTALICLIIGLPLAGFLINGILGLASDEYRKRKTLIGVLANIAVFVPFLISGYLFLTHSADASAIVVTLVYLD